jgi:hypothetical protein
MNLSLYTGGVKPYLEYGWVCAPNTAGQSIAANTITTLTMDTEVADTGNFGSIASNQITLAAGTYYYEAMTVSGSNDQAAAVGSLGLYNNTAAIYVARSQGIQTNIRGNACGISFHLNGQFTLTAASSLSLVAYIATASTIPNASAQSASSSLTTAGANQRTTIKLWKLA